MVFTLATIVFVSQSFSVLYPYPQPSTNSMCTVATFLPHKCIRDEQPGVQQQQLGPGDSINIHM